MDIFELLIFRVIELIRIDLQKEMLLNEVVFQELDFDEELKILVVEKESEESGKS